MPNGTYKFTPDKKAAVIKLLSQGCRRYSAMRAVGMTGQMLSYWMARDLKFAHQVIQAEMVAGAKVEDALFKSAISGNVTAQIFYLCNRKPDEWRHVNTPTLPTSQQLQPGQHELTWRVVYDSPPAIHQPPLDALIDGHSDTAP